jgi:hypothetical protein
MAASWAAKRELHRRLGIVSGHEAQERHHTVTGTLRCLLLSTQRRRAAHSELGHCGASSTTDLSAFEQPSALVQLSCASRTAWLAAACAFLCKQRWPGAQPAPSAAILKRRAEASADRAPARQRAVAGSRWQLLASTVELSLDWSLAARLGYALNLVPYRRVVAVCACSGRYIHNQ